LFSAIGRLHRLLFIYTPFEYSSEVSQLLPTALVRVVSDELAQAPLTAIALLSQGGSAILDNRKRAAPGAADFFVLHIQRLA
jgi:hypothetical protein